nr:succinate dehydrogenase assembly factor 2 [Parendozoicomonas haliclonae]
MSEKTQQESTQHVPTQEPGQEEMNRLFWHSRRGMLELDVLLVPFTQEVYPTLSAEQRATYVELLACEDADLFVWFMEKEIPAEQNLADMIRMIIDRARSLPPVH